MEQAPEDDQLSDLPTITDCSAFPVVLYKAHYLFKDSLLGVLSSRHHFQARPTDILLASLPKSGTTWLKALTFSSLYRTSLPDVSDLRHPLRVSNPHHVVPFIEIESNLDFSSMPSPRLLSTHLPFDLLPTSIADSGSKIVYVCRNPKDTFVSSWHFWNRMRERAGEEPIPLEASFDQFCDGVSVMGPYWNHVVGYWNASRANDAKVLFVKYEDMIADPIGELKRVAGFMGCPFTEEEEERGGVAEGIVKLCGFESLSNLEVNREGVIETITLGDYENKFFFRRGGVGGWGSLLSPEMGRRLDEITASKFAGTGLSV
ncbi:cytosolic sulfotransferase 17-like isoform X1 [Asparagus officinalis]|uniref:cytosolic sulfotransferase 17-like isoform X1 n=1 Tax=Asparagus officinalis TaxID=4686 RepID=UPI00098E72E7|nr:cytosolic sulfotransferase 17-like isoform X1 [Asparagus officinalis]